MLRNHFRQKRRYSGSFALSRRTRRCSSFHAFLLCVLLIFERSTDETYRSVGTAFGLQIPNAQEADDANDSKRNPLPSVEADDTTVVSSGSCSVNLNNHVQQQPPQASFNGSKSEGSRKKNYGDIEKLERITIDSHIGGGDEGNDGFYDPVTPDPSCDINIAGIVTGGSEDCWAPPDTTIESSDQVTIDATALYGGDDPSSAENDHDETSQDSIKQKKKKKKLTVVDKHWGSDANILNMRDTLRRAGTGVSSTSQKEAEFTRKSDSKDKNATTSAAAMRGETSHDKKINPFENRRPPIFLLPGLASTRLVSWKFKSCSHPLLSDIKVQDYVWMNVNMLLQMATIDVTCFKECMKLGLNQTDTDDVLTGCKLRPDEGLDAISSLAPGSLSSNLLVGGTNTVYAWLTQWLADNLGYDVTSIVGLPYDWRLSPDVMEARDGFMTLTRKRIEAAVTSNGAPGIMVAHSMGNNVFRYFLNWLRNEMHEEAYATYTKQAERRAAIMQQQSNSGTVNAETESASYPGWMGGIPRSEYENLKQKAMGGRMYTLSNPFVAGLDNLWKSYFKGPYNGHPLNSDNEKKDESVRLKGSSSSITVVQKEKHEQLWELAQIEGDSNWMEWVNSHIWTYVGLSAPLLGAANPLRAVLSGENMGLPIADDVARSMELSFGSTHTLNIISTKTGFCDLDELSFDEKGDDDFTILKYDQKGSTKYSNLACLDELIEGIEKSGNSNNAKDKKDPWRDFPALRNILKDRVDWDSDFPTVSISLEKCRKAEKKPCAVRSKMNFGPKDVQDGHIFTQFSKLWKEEGDPLITKREQLETSWWNRPFPNLLDSTWDRPLIKHVIMAYGVDIPTEVGYKYRKEELLDENEMDKKNKKGSSKKGPTNIDKFDDLPTLQSVIWEEANGVLFEEDKPAAPKSLTESVLKKKPKKRPLNIGGVERKLQHSGDGSVPYLSLAWAQTWLLHATRAMRHSGGIGASRERISDDNALDSIKVSHRPKGGSEWIEGGKVVTDNRPGKNNDDGGGGDLDTGTSHPHGTKYKPDMVRFQSLGKSRSTGMQYTTTVIEAIGVEHKETTRNYDILAAVFTDVLKHMHDDLGLG